MKMVILPKLLYLFQNIALPLNRKFFDQINTLMIKLACAGKLPRIQWKKLQLPYELGVFSAPNTEINLVAHAHFAHH